MAYSIAEQMTYGEDQPIFVDGNPFMKPKANYDGTYWFQRADGAGSIRVEREDVAAVLEYLAGVQMIGLGDPGDVDQYLRWLDAEAPDEARAVLGEF